MIWRTLNTLNYAHLNMRYLTFHYNPKAHRALYSSAFAPLPKRSSSADTAVVASIARFIWT